MRRIAVVTAVALVTVLGLGTPTTASPRPEAALRSAFNTWLNGGEAVTWSSLEHGSAAEAHSATTAWFADTLGIPGLPNSGIGAVRLSPVPGSPAGPFCDTDVFGMWIVDIWTKPELQAEPDFVWRLDGVMLENRRTPLKPAFDPGGEGADFFGGPVFWFSDGVPVYGSLEPGLHVLELEIPGIVTLANTVEVVTCG